MSPKFKNTLLVLGLILLGILVFSFANSRMLDQKCKNVDGQLTCKI